MVFGRSLVAAPTPAAAAVLSVATTTTTTTTTASGEGMVGWALGSASPSLVTRSSRSVVGHRVGLVVFVGEGGRWKGGCGVLVGGSDMAKLFHKLCGGGRLNCQRVTVDSQWG